MTNKNLQLSSRHPPCRTLQSDILSSNLWSHLSTGRVTKQDATSSPPQCCLKENNLIIVSEHLHSLIVTTGYTVIGSFTLSSMRWDYYRKYLFLNNSLIHYCNRISWHPENLINFHVENALYDLLSTIIFPSSFFPLKGPGFNTFWQDLHVVIGLPDPMTWQRCGLASSRKIHKQL